MFQEVLADLEICFGWGSMALNWINIYFTVAAWCRNVEGNETSQIWKENLTNVETPSSRKTDWRFTLENLTRKLPKFKQHLTNWGSGLRVQWTPPSSPSWMSGALPQQRWLWKKDLHLLEFELLWLLSRWFLWMSPKKHNNQFLWLWRFQPDQCGLQQTA